MLAVAAAIVTTAVVATGADAAVEAGTDRAEYKLELVKGGTAGNEYGTYGTQGVAADGNLPCSRFLHAHWTDASGNAYIYGGKKWASAGSERLVLSDLWRYSSSTGKWTWLHGAKCTASSSCTADTIATSGAAASLTPGARVDASAFTQGTDLYLFGGCKEYDTGHHPMNDVWKFDTSTATWTLVAGSATHDVSTSAVARSTGTVNTFGASNTPGGRRGTRFMQASPGVVAMAATDSVYLFGGSSNQITNQADKIWNDLWAFQPSTGHWKCVDGCSVGSDQDRESGRPGSRLHFAGFRVGEVLYVWGGLGLGTTATPGMLNDIWKFDTSATSPSWTQIAGSQAAGVDDTGDTTKREGSVYPSLATRYDGTSPTPGVASAAAFFSDDSGGLYVFGGVSRGLDSVYPDNFNNELWRFSTKNETWICLTGKRDLHDVGSIGSAGVSDASYIPAARHFASGWWATSTTTPGYAYIFGGRFQTSSTEVTGQDLFKLELNTCGDGRLRFNDACDDGNNAAADGCAVGCAVETGWNCTGASETASSTCLPVCGDGMYIGWPSASIREYCDDGNRVAGDGCSSSCTIESGYVCSHSTMGTSTCTTVCGDGVYVSAEEDCDDGNEESGDGCTASSCLVEDGYECTASTGSTLTTCKEIVVAADDLVAIIEMTEPTYEWINDNLKQFKDAFRGDIAFNLNIPLSLIAIMTISRSSGSELLSISSDALPPSEKVDFSSVRGVADSSLQDFHASDLLQRSDRNGDGSSLASSSLKDVPTTSTVPHNAHAVLASVLTGGQWAATQNGRKSWRRRLFSASRSHSGRAGIHDGSQTLQERHQLSNRNREMDVQLSSSLLAGGTNIEFVIYTSRNDSITAEGLAQTLEDKMANGDMKWGKVESKCGCTVEARVVNTTASGPPGGADDPFPFLVVITLTVAGCFVIGVLAYCCHRRRQRKRRLGQVEPDWVVAGSKDKSESKLQSSSLQSVNMPAHLKGKKQVDNNAAWQKRAGAPQSINAASAAKHKKRADVSASEAAARRLQAAPASRAQSRDGRPKNSRDGRPKSSGGQGGGGSKGGSSSRPGSQAGGKRLPAKKPGTPGSGGSRKAGDLKAQLRAKTQGGRAPSRGQAK